MVNSERHGRQGQVRVVLRLRVSDFEQLAKVLGRLAALPGVHHAFRRHLR
jgi:(p)ppGpp synthase/HD superfamily hydrolase